MRLFFAMTAIVGLLASGVGCMASPDGAESVSSDQTAEHSDYLVSPFSKAKHGPTAASRGCTEDVICIDGKHWDNQLCRCVGPVCDPIPCHHGQHWDQASCSCVGPVCDPLLCVEGKVWDPTTCSCVCDVEPDHCLAGQAFDPATCSCACVDIVDCIDGEHWDPTTCECVGPSSGNP